MKYFLMILNVIMVQILWGFMIGTIILIMGWSVGYNNVSQSTNILFVIGGIFLFFGPSVLRPKGLNFRPTWVVNWYKPKIEVIEMKTEPSTDEALLRLSEEEQKKHLSVESFVILLQMYGIGITLFIYSLVFYTLFGR